MINPEAPKSPISIPESVTGGTPAKAFFSETFSNAAKQATKYAGKDGRLATLPDIIDARLGSPLGEPAWEQYFNTMSAEYFGYTKSGIPVIVVAHGVGPMSTPEGVIAVYNSPLKPRNESGRTCEEGRITQKKFQDLVDGKFGAVEIVDYGSYTSLYKYPFSAQISSLEAAEDPVVRARLGPRYAEYLFRHSREANHWAEEENKKRWKLRSKESRGPLINTRHIGFERSKIIGMEDNPNSSYWNFARLEFRSDNSPLVHLLTITQLMLMNRMSLYSNVHCKEGSDPARLVGIKGKGRIEGITSTPLS